MEVCSFTPSRRSTVRLISDRAVALPNGLRVVPFKITITEDAERQFEALSARDQRILQAAIVSRLQHQPTTLTRAVKRLRPNPVAEYELRVGDLRVLYDVKAEEVIISVVGLKVGNTLVVAGEEFCGHQDSASEESREGSSGDPD